MGIKTFIERMFDDPPESAKPITVDTPPLDVLKPVLKSKPKFDRNAYMRRYMQERRAKKKIGS